MKSGIEGVNEFEYALIQYHSSSHERINIGVILKDEERVEYKMINSFGQIQDAYRFENIEGLDFPLAMFAKNFADKKINVFQQGYALCNSIEVYIPDFPLLTTRDDFENALLDLWSASIGFIIKAQDKKTNMNMDFIPFLLSRNSQISGPADAFTNKNFDSDLIMQTHYDAMEDPEAIRIKDKLKNFDDAHRLFRKTNVSK